MFIKETLETKVIAACDVLVCGGGIAGVSASLAASRQGKKVILLEKQFMLGGLGTSGLVTIYLPLCDGCGRQVSYGIAEELLRLSVSMGFEDKYPDNWLNDTDAFKWTDKDKRFEAQYNPYLFAILAEQLLIENGVTILYGSYAVGVSKTDGKIDAIIMENKSGRQAIAVKSVVDATGDCDIAYFAGAPTQEFRQGNSLAAWYYSLGQNGYHLNMIGFSDIPDEQKNETNEADLLTSERFTGLDGAELSEMMQFSHAAVLRNIVKSRETDRMLIPTSIAAIPQIRMTRRIVGEYTLDDSEQHTYFADSIGMIPNWKKAGPIYEVPFRTLFSKNIKNLMIAGRCISVTDSMWDIMRVIPCCAVTGQAAGTAAAVFEDFTNMDIKELQHILTHNGVVLHERELN